MSGKNVGVLRLDWCAQSDYAQKLVGTAMFLMPKPIGRIIALIAGIQIEFRDLIRNGNVGYKGNAAI